MTAPRLALSPVFSIVGLKPAPSLRLTGGLAGQKMPAGSQQRSLGRARIPSVRSMRLYRGGLYLKVLGNVPMSAGEFLWQVCPLLPPKDDYHIALTSTHCAGWLQAFVDGNPLFEITQPCRPTCSI